jgi:beta-galactosidase/beta-glucuronidase
MTASKLHPRPRLIRDAWTDLCGTWQFAYDDENLGLDERWQDRGDRFDRNIEVPYPPESKLSGIGDRSPHAICWYRREVHCKSAPGKRMLLHFGAVDYAATVWVNGDMVGRHEGGHTPFCADITPSLDPAGKQIIVLRSEDDTRGSEQPRGKQDWRDESHAIWYHRTSGIWQPVWLEAVPETHIRAVQFTPDLDQGSVTVEVLLSNSPRPGTSCEIVLSIGGAELQRQRTALVRDRQNLSLHLHAFEHGQDRAHLLWTPETPNLVDADITLIDESGRLVDTCRSYFGMRSCGVGGQRFLLNDRPYFVRSVLSQGFWPDSHLAAPSDAAIRREVELIKALGFNAVRNHQKVEDPRFLHWCDRLGLLVWGEMPSAYQYSQRMASRMMREWMEVVERDRSHPCIVTWVPLNESWGVPDIARRADQQAFATALYSITKALDKTRPVISNDGWEHTVSDILGVHDYSTVAGHLSERYGAADQIRAAFAHFGPQRRRLVLQDIDIGRLPVMVTEFGGISYHPKSGEAWFGYATVTSPEEYLEALQNLFGALHGSSEIAGYCYTQLTDTLQETNGLLDENRNPKLPLDHVRAIVSRPSEALRAEYLDLARSKAKLNDASEQIAAAVHRT